MSFSFTEHPPHMENDPKVLVSKSILNKYGPIISKDKLDEANYFLVQMLIERNNSAKVNEFVELVGQVLGTPEPAYKMKTIIDMPEKPSQAAPYKNVRLSGSNRVNSKSWTEYEDLRLHGAIALFGFDDWGSIAKFVGIQRTKWQCSQRWNRCLNPLISKGPWTDDEDLKLIDFVDNRGIKSWKYIADIIGNRSDVQCRYRYTNLQKKKCVFHNDCTCKRDDLSIVIKSTSKELIPLNYKMYYPYYNETINNQVDHTHAITFDSNKYFQKISPNFTETPKIEYNKVSCNNEKEEKENKLSMMPYNLLDDIIFNKETSIDYMFDMEDNDW